MQEVRCQTCGKLLCRAEYFRGEIKCARCKQVNQINIISQKYLVDKEKNCYN